MMKRTAVFGALAVVMVSLIGCSDFRVEHQGNEVGEGICDLRTATPGSNDFKKAIDKINNNLDDAARIAGRPIKEDLSDIQNNFQDLFNHVPDNQQALTQQDISVIQRNAEQVAKNATGYQQRFWQGVTEGLGDCAG
jgi:hypothetical protein